VLGVSRDASDDEIKEAYRKKVKEFHPDTSDREDAAEMFKKVKEAYEVVYTGTGTGDTGVGSSNYQGSRGDHREQNKQKEQKEQKEQKKQKTDDGADWRNGGKKEEGFGTGTAEGWRRSGDISGGAGERTETNTERGRRGGFYAGSGGARREGWKGAEGKGKRRTYKKDGTEDRENPEEYEVHDEYEMGWKLGRAEKVGWFVFAEGETAPYADGTKMLYLDLDGNISTEAVFFGSREAAEENYEEHYGSDEDFGYEHEKEKSHRGFSYKGGSYRRRTEERTDGFEEEEWGKKRETDVLDGLWRLYYQEKSAEGGQKRRWGVTTKVTGDDRFVNPGGEYQRAEFWFDEKTEAVKAYKRYVERMKEAREGFEVGVDKGEGKDEGEVGGWSAPAGQEDETLLFRTADKSITFLEALEDAVEPLKENSLTAVVAVCLLFGVVAYIFEPVRDVLVVLSTPVYVGFAAMVRSPHLIFFVVAYAAIVTVLVVAKMTTRF